MDDINFSEIYKDNREHARHHESQRTTVSNLIIFTSAAASSIISVDQAITIADMPLAVVVIFLGMFGMIFSIKYGFRIGYHLSVSRKVLKHTQPEIFETLTRYQRESEAESSYPKWIIRPHNTKYWIVLHVCIIVYGSVLGWLCFLDWRVVPLTN